MPRYCYHCKKCDKSYEVVHSMGHKPTKCSLCESEGTLEKVPTLFSVDVDTTVDSSTAKQRVDEFITSAKEELKQHRDELSKKEYQG